jgi:anthranilate phosphoribosyltransferase
MNGENGKNGNGWKIYVISGLAALVSALAGVSVMLESSSRHEANRRLEAVESLAADIRTSRDQRTKQLETIENYIAEHKRWHENHK